MVTRSQKTPRAAIPEIEAILTQFLKECDIVYTHDICLDPSFRDACCLDAQRRGFDLTILGKAFDVGVAIADTTYRHLPNYSTRIFVAIFTAVAAHIDDSCERYKEGMGDFIGRFLSHKRQQFEALDYFASLLRETSDHWGAFASNIVTTAGMDFIPATVVENELNDMEVSNMRRYYCFWAHSCCRSHSQWLLVFPGSFGEWSAFRAPTASWDSLPN